MTAQEAADILQRSKIEPHLYNIGAPRLAECFVLQNEGGTWVTYDWEKGQQNNKRTFPSEDAAARYFVEKVVSIASMVAGHPIVLK